MPDYTKKQYVIFSSSESGSIDSSQIVDAPEWPWDTSVDGTQMFAKWETDEVPSSVAALTTKGPYLSHIEFLPLMTTPDWYRPISQ
jgi:hypothetical protein